MESTPKGETGGKLWQAEQLLAHRYRVKECLQPAGSCHLHRVQDVFRGELQLVTRPSPRVLSTAGGRQWFNEYAKTALSMPAHPNMLPCTRMDAAEGVPFLVMPDAQGVCWDRAIAKGYLNSLPPMLDIAAQLARLLAWLHGADQVHGNVKPANVLLTSTNVVKMWKYPQEGAKTRAYASPEQMAGGEPDMSWDIWGWALSILHMFEGKVAWPQGPKAPVALEYYRRKGPTLKGIPLMPGPLADLLSRCMREDPDDRPDSMDEIVEEMRGILENASEGSPSTFSALAETPEEAEVAAESDEFAIEGILLEDADEGEIELELVGEGEEDGGGEVELELIPENEEDEADDLLVELELIPESEEEPSSEEEPQEEGMQPEEVEEDEGAARPRPARWTARRDGNSDRRPRGGKLPPRR